MALVRLARADDAYSIGEIFGAAFLEDPTWIMDLSDAQERLAAAQVHYRKEVLRNPEHVDVAISEDSGEIVGALFWQPPAQAVLKRWRDTFTVRLARIVVPFLASGKSGISHHLKVTASRPTTPHWSIEELAVDTRARGQGIASILLENRLAEIDRSSSQLVFLEATTSGSRRLYERYGFRATSVIPTIPGHQSTAMLREP